LAQTNRKMVGSMTILGVIGSQGNRPDGTSPEADGLFVDILKQQSNHILQKSAGC